MPTIVELLRYGIILEDDGYETKCGNFIRIYKVEYNEKNYYIAKRNGDLVAIMEESEVLRCQ